MAEEERATAEEEGRVMGEEEGVMGVMVTLVAVLHSISGIYWRDLTVLETPKVDRLQLLGIVYC